MNIHALTLALSFAFAALPNPQVIAPSRTLLPGAGSVTTFAQEAQQPEDEPCGEMAQIIEAEVKAQAAKRRLDEYERLGPLCRELVSFGPVQDVEQQLKDFIWRHWKEKRRGFVIATFYSIEGHPSTSFTFIEPSAEGRWRIDTKIERKLFDLKTRQPRRQTNGYVAYMVKRVPKGKNRPGYQLIFLDERGKHITAF